MSKTRLYQGRLDGLCGVYAVLNSVRIIEPVWLDANRENLFIKLVSSLDNGQPLGNIIADGIDFRKLGQLFDIIAREIKRDKQIALHRKVAMKSEPEAIDDYWLVLQQHFEQSNTKASAILGLSGRHDHWTAIRSISAKTIVIDDSDGLPNLKRAYCNLDNPDGVNHYELWPTQTYLISSCQ